MGIPQLNHYLQNNTQNGINEISLNELRGKTIVVDTSIYLYKYLSEEALIEGFYHLITKLRQISNTPLFVFDGKPPAEKQNELIERKQRKEKAKHEYDNLLQRYEKEQNPRKKMSIKTTDIVEVDRIRVKGKQEPETIFGVFDTALSDEDQEVISKYLSKFRSWEYHLFIWGIGFR